MPLRSCVNCADKSLSEIWAVLMTVLQRKVADQRHKATIGAEALQPVKFAIKAFHTSNSRLRQKFMIRPG
jgi:hypothetical protein